MPNVTISLDTHLLKSSREYARRHGTSLNALIRSLLTQTVDPSRKAWAEELFALMDEAKGDSKGWKWNREEIQRYG